MTTRSPTGRVQAVFQEAGALPADAPKMVARHARNIKAGQVAV